MKGTNDSNGRIVLRQNVEINSNKYFSCHIFFREWNRWPRGLETSLRNHQEKCLWVQSYFSDLLWFIERLSVEIFIYLLRLMIDRFLFFLNFPSYRKLFFGEMCRSASLVAWMVNTNLDAQKLRLRQHRPFMLIKLFEQPQQVGRVKR